MRSKYSSMALTRDGRSVLTVPLARVTLYEVGTSTPLADTIYASGDVTNMTTLPNPFTADANGNFAFYLDIPQSVRIVLDGVGTGLGLGVFSDDYATLPPAPEDTLNSHAPLTITNTAGTSDRLRVRDALTYIKGPLHVGDDTGATADLIHGYYQNNTVSGAYTSTTGIVDAFAVEVTGQTSNDSDLGAVLGVMRVRDSTGGIVSGRALAGQLFVHDGALKADRESVELGVHNALAITSKADNRTTFDKVFGTSAILITAFTGSIESGLGGGTAVDANTAIIITTINSGGTACGFKQFEVFWDKNGIKAWQVNSQGNVVAGGGGNNDDQPAYGFLDTNGDVDTGTGMFWGGNDVVGITTNTVERMRVDGNGNMGVGGTAPSGSRVYATGGLIEAAGGIKNSGVRIGALSIPTAIAAHTDNYVPSTGTGFGTYQISATGAFELRGLALSQTVAGHEVDLINGGGNTITIVHAAAGSPSNPFNTHTGANHSLTPGKSVTVIWTGAAWRFKAVT